MPFQYNKAKQPYLGDQIVANAKDWQASTFDGRIFRLSQQTQISYAILNDAFRFYAWKLDCTVNDCLDYCDNSVSKLTKLVKCVNDKRLCYAVKSRGDQTLAMILDS